MLWFWAIYGGLLGVAAAWFVITSLAGLRRLANLTTPEWDAGAGAARVSVIVPARNEEAEIAAALASLAAQDMPVEVIAVDDRSTDRTGALIDAAAAAAPGRVRALHVRALPQGWLGKTHAMWSGAALAGGDWLLFTDADVIFRPDALRRTIAYAEAMRADHLTLLPDMVTHSAGERMMAAFFLFFVAAARLWKVPDPKSRMYAGAGAFNMLRRSAYEAIGTMQALRLAVVEDMEIGRRVKRAGLASRVAFAPGLARVRWAHGALGMVRNLTKNSYASVGFRWWLALPLMLLGVAVHMVPFAALWIAPGWTRAGFAVELAAIFCFYVGGSRLSGISPAYFLLHPVAASLVIYAMLRSVLSGIRHGGVVWRGTLYPIAELRRWMDEQAG